MIDALIAGKLTAAPEQRTGKNDKPFVTCKVRAAGGDGEGIVINVIAFSASACNGLLALDEGESVALAGSLTPKAWIDREGAARPALDLVVHQVLTAYAVQRKRKAVSGASEHDHGHDGQFTGEPLDF